MNQLNTLFTRVHPFSVKQFSSMNYGMAFKKFYNIQKVSSCSEQAVILHYSDYHFVLHGLANDKKKEQIIIKK
jgi:hypothetical protein